jgi:hypothetical protein
MHKSLNMSIKTICAIHSSALDNPISQEPENTLHFKGAVRRVFEARLCS